MDKRKQSAKNINVLFTCIGRRVSLLESFRSAAGRLEVKASFVGTDMTELSSAMQVCDESFVVRPVDEPGYMDELLRIVKTNGVGLVVPTVDLDLKVLSQNKAKFSELGCCVLISSPEVVEICQDKRKTCRFLSENRFDTPVTMSAAEALAKDNLSWPLFVKPWDGYASRGSAVVTNRAELEFFGKRVPNAICQEYVEAVEYTCDAYVDFDMKVRCVVPRKRIEVRAGEVSKGQVVKHPVICSETARLVDKLGAGPGVVTIQLFLTEDEQIKFIEINPRFGGGVLLSIKAGADFPRWILQEMIGHKPEINSECVRDGLIMLRYDSEVWVEG